MNLAILFVTVAIYVVVLGQNLFPGCTTPEECRRSYYCGERVGNCIADCSLWDAELHGTNCDCSASRLCADL